MIWQAETKGIFSNEEGEGELKIMAIRSEKRRSMFRISSKILVSLILLTVIATGTGIYTYSWFTSSASSNMSQITVGTFELKLDNNTAIFNLKNIEPGLATEEQIMSFTNAGNINMLLKGELTIDSAKFNNVDSKKKAYKIIAQVYKPINPNEADTETNRIYIHSTVDRKRGESIENFNKELVNKLNSDQSVALEEGNSLVFKTNDKLICRFQLILDIEEAVNEHQGDKVTAKFEVKAKQNIDGAVFQ